VISNNCEVFKGKYSAQVEYVCGNEDGTEYVGYLENAYTSGFDAKNKAASDFTVGPDTLVKVPEVYETAGCELSKSNSRLLLLMCKIGTKITGFDSRLYKLSELTFSETK
jgi:hypothetical protein